MKIFFYSLLIISILNSCSSSTEEIKTQKTIKKEENSNYIDINTDELLVTTALLAAPEESRADCKVIGYNMTGEFVTLKEGSNEFICLADNPNKEGFSTACYHKSLEPFMSRGRELKAEGKTHQEIFDIREEEVKSGKLKMGEPGATLHIYYGDKKQYDTESNSVPGAIYRYVVYLPWATSESTGLPEQPTVPNHPWIMNPGTHKAHIMISPLNNK